MSTISPCTRIASSTSATEKWRRTRRSGRKPELPATLLGRLARGFLTQRGERVNHLLVVLGLRPPPASVSAQREQRSNDAETQVPTRTHVAEEKPDAGRAKNQQDQLHGRGIR